MQRLVVPRIAAMMLVAPLLNILIVVVGIVAGFVAAVAALNVTPGSYWASFGAFTTPLDIWVSVIKALIFGFLVVVIACQRGLEAKGGLRGVADGVNAAVFWCGTASILKQESSSFLPPPGWRSCTRFGWARAAETAAPA
ncbi:ABC-type transporter Mla maintaining outer membrane lipid asymmetry permease subunit MlaE [Nocardia sp. GAS34]